MPPGAVGRGDLPVVERDGNGRQGDRSLSPNSPQDRQQGLRMVSAEEASAYRPSRPAWPRLIGLPSFVPVAFLIAKAAFVRSEINRRSFSAIEVQH